MSPDDLAEDPIALSTDGAVTTLWLNRPAKRNAVTYEMWAELPDRLAQVAATSARVLIVRGVGGHFCAGADITGLGSRLADAGTPGGYREVNAAAEAALTNFPLPTIAVIEGNCIGGGWQIASACDLRIAQRGVLLGITPAKLGITYPTEAIRRTVALVGPSATKRLLYTAELIDGDEALRLGFLDDLVADGDLDDAVSALCRTLSERSLLTQLATKATVNALVDSDPNLAATVASFEKIATDSVDLAEGLASFAERRSAVFTWRPEST